MSTSAFTPTLVAESGFHSEIWAEFLAPVLSGQETFLRQVELPSHADRVSFDDLGSVVIDFAADGSSSQLLVGAGWTALVSRVSHRNGTVTVRAADLATAKAGVALFAERIPEPEPVVDHEVAIDFWQVGDDVYRRTRRLEAPVWEEIAGHYPDEVAAAVEILLATDFHTASGRLVLWHGPPGTGKTTALRALARTWAGRCRVQVLLGSTGSTRRWSGPGVVWPRSSSGPSLRRRHGAAGRNGRSAPTRCRSPRCCIPALAVAPRPAPPRPASISRGLRSPGPRGPATLG